MVNPFYEVNWKPGVSERRKFAVSLMIGFPCVAIVLLVATRWQSGAWHFVLPLALGGGGAALGILLWARPKIALPFYVVWYVIACCAGLIVGNTLLAAIYLLLFAPLGLAMRVMGRKAFSKCFDRNAATYWRDAQSPTDIARYYQQF
jgi:hypothetical protein